MTVLVFGATGALGSSIVSELTSEGSTVLRISRRAGEYSDVSLDNKNWIKEVTKLGPVSGVVWAQGVNSSGTVPTIPLDDLRNAFEANVVWRALTYRVQKFLDQKLGHLAKAAASAASNRLSRSGRFCSTATASRKPAADVQAIDL